MDWIAGTLELIGMWKVGSKNRVGFLFNIACCICWISYVIRSGNAYGILMLAVPATFVNIRNFIAWRPTDTHTYRSINLKDTLL